MSNVRSHSANFKCGNHRFPVWTEFNSVFLPVSVSRRVVSVVVVVSLSQEFLPDQFVNDAANWRMPSPIMPVR
jgi:hypothetical protein